MFALETATKAKLNDVLVLSQKNRQPDENPGAKLVLTIELPADMLVHFDGSLRSFLFAATAGAKQGAVPGLESEELTHAGQKVGTMRWSQEMTGYAFTIDMGLGGKRSSPVISDCKLDGWRLTPKAGGVTAKFNLESADVSEAMWGKLAKLKSREITILLAPPEVDDRQAEIPHAPPAPSNVKDATELFIEGGRKAH